MDNYQNGSSVGGQSELSQQLLRLKVPIQPQRHGKCQLTSNPFGPCAMALLLSVHVHLGRDFQVVSALVLCMQTSRI